MAGRACGINQQCFRRAANAGAAHLGIGNNIARHVERGIAMHIDMTNAFQMGENRHARFVLHAPDQIFAAARHDHVNIAVQSGEHHADGSAVGAGDKLHPIWVMACRAQRMRKTAMNGFSRMYNFRTGAQNHRIAGLETQSGCIGGHIGAAFINHARDAQRHAHAGNIKARRHLPRCKFCPDRVGQGDNRFDRNGNSFHPRRVQHDAVKPRGTDILFFGFAKVTLIGGDNFVGTRAQRIGGALQRRVFFLSARQRQPLRGGARAGTDRGHDFGQILIGGIFPFLGHLIPLPGSSPDRLCERFPGVRQILVGRRFPCWRDR